MKKKKEGSGVDVRGTKERSSRAERGEEGLEVEKPGGQTGSQSAGDQWRKKKEWDRKQTQTGTDTGEQPDNRADT